MPEEPQRVLGLELAQRMLGREPQELPEQWQLVLGPVPLVLESFRQRAPARPVRRPCG